MICMPKVYLQSPLKEQEFNKVLLCCLASPVRFLGKLHRALSNKCNAFLGHLEVILLFLLSRYYRLKYICCNKVPCKQLRNDTFMLLNISNIICMPT